MTPKTKARKIYTLELYIKRHYRQSTKATHTIFAYHIFSTSLFIREIWFPLWQLTIKKRRVKITLEGSWRNKPLCSVWLESKMIQLPWKTVWQFPPAKLKIPYDPAIPLLYIYLRKFESRVWMRYLNTHVHNILTHNSQKV